MQRYGQIGRSITLAVAVAVGGCSWQPVEVPDSSAGAHAEPVASVDAVGQRVAAIALEQVGVPYRYGGATPAGFDCSGLVHYAYGQIGRSVPRTTGELWRRARPVPRDELRAGDLLFFSIAGKMQHVGLYVGDGYFAHAPQTGRSVEVESLSADFYRAALLRGGRLH